MPITIEEISRQHDRKSFDCGNTELNRFIHQQARQKKAKHISKTYVICDSNAPSTIIGYHTLTGYSVSAPPAHKIYKHYPHPLSAVKLARIAVDLTRQKQNFGELLLIDAIYRTVLVEQQISTIGLFVDPLSTKIIPFYQHYGFLPVNEGDSSCLEMWLPISTCIEVVRTIL